MDGTSVVPVDRFQSPSARASLIGRQTLDCAPSPGTSRSSVSGGSPPASAPCRTWSSVTGPTRWSPTRSLERRHPGRRLLQSARHTSPPVRITRGDRTAHLVSIPYMSCPRGRESSRGCTEGCCEYDQMPSRSHLFVSRSCWARQVRACPPAAPARWAPSSRTASALYVGRTTTRTLSRSSVSTSRARPVALRRARVGS
jgi:hypothetical protein